MTKILLVEHEMTTRLIVQTALEREGYRVITSEPDATRMDLVDAVSPDLVVLDASERQDASGVTAHQLVDRYPRIPVLVIGVEAHSGRWGDGDAWVSRSTDTRPLRATVRRLLNPHAV